MNATRLRTLGHWIARVLVALGMLAAGLSKFSPSSGWAARFHDWGYAPWFLTVIAVLEIVGAVGLLVPRTLRPAAAVLTVVLLGAGYTHLTHGQGAQVLRPLAYLAVLALALWLRPPHATGAAG